MTIEEAYDILWLNKDIKYTKKDVKNAYESALELELFDINENKHLSEEERLKLTDSIKATLTEAKDTILKSMKKRREKKTNKENSKEEVKETNKNIKMNEDTNFHMTIENAYNYLGLNPSQKYTKEEVEEKYNKLANAISKEILLGNDSEDDLIISQLKNNLLKLTEAKNKVLENIESKKENSIKLYEGIAPYMGLEKVPQYQKVDLDIEGSKKNKLAYGLAKTLAGALAILLVGTGIGYLIASKVKGNTKVKNTPTSTPTIEVNSNNIITSDMVDITPTPSINNNNNDVAVDQLQEKHKYVLTLLEEIKNLEQTDKTSEVLLNKEKEMLKLAKEVESVLTDEEKTMILSLVDDNYARGMNQVKGVNLSEEEGLIAVSYLNGIAPELTQANTNDITLDFILDFETYWNKLNYEAKKYLGANIKTKGENYAQYGDLVSDYILNEKDAVVISYFINERLKINNEAHLGNRDKAREMARSLIEQDVKMYTSFENIKIQNKEYNVGSLTPWAQYLINFMAYADTGYLEDEAIITTINDCEIVNVKGKAYHYNSDEDFIMQPSARNNINWHLEANSINAYNAFIEQSKKLCK